MSSNNSAIKFTLNKTERLSSRKIIAGLYESGFFVAKYPIRINYQFTELPVKDLHLQAMFSVSKKRFSRAVDRNRIKRLLREIYRHQKHQLYARLEEKNLKMAIGIIFTGNQMLDYWQMETAFNKTYKKLLAVVDEYQSEPSGQSNLLPLNEINS
jgi:ribonuclease P protein component